MLGRHMKSRLYYIELGEKFCLSGDLCCCVYRATFSCTLTYVHVYRTKTQLLGKLSRMRSEVRLNNIMYLCSVYECVFMFVCPDNFTEVLTEEMRVRVLEQQHPQKWWSLNCSFHQNLNICIKDWFVWWLSSAEWEIHTIYVH